MENFKVVREFENKLLNFREVEATSSFSRTPSKQEVVAMFCKKYNSNEECCVVKKIYGNFGTSTFTIVVRIYPDKESRDKIEKKKVNGKSSPAPAKEAGK
ncbi:hypothetical protein J4447_04430 [Candidatus Pacearchaeota archaeon]|nr:hypothetical protein [Candidatus Pacearchaeota archaeon]